MLTHDITCTDLSLLEYLRIDRLRGLFAEHLLSCVMYVEHDTLFAHCLTPTIVDNLLADIDELSEYAWQIVGVKSISLYFCQEEVYRTQHSRTHPAPHEQHQ